MTPDLLLLTAAALLYLGAFVSRVVTHRRGGGSPWWRRSVIGAGFLCQTVFLHWRGQAIGGCPMTNSFELLTFVSWAVVLFYFVVGPAYRLSLLGFFTSPLAFLIQAAALLTPSARMAPVPRVSHGFWTELHAALSLMAYGAFGLACVAGIMFLIEDRRLKRHRRLDGVLSLLPPIHHLSRAIHGLILTGTVLLSAGILSAYQMPDRPSAFKLGVVWMVWAVYAAIAVYERWRGMSARRAAGAAVAGFVIPVLSLWVVTGG